MSQSNGKPWWQSKTIWLNLALILGAFAEDFTGWLASIGITEGWLIGALGIANLALRSITTQPLTGRAPDEKGE
jgi:hypothetical protein